MLTIHTSKILALSTAHKHQHKIQDTFSFVIQKCVIVEHFQLIPEKFL